MKNKGDSKPSYRELWDEAYNKASFFKSDKNSKEYWDKAAESDGGGLAGEGHISLIKNYLLDEGLIDSRSTVLDVGCGGGDYVVYFTMDTPLENAGSEPVYRGSNSVRFAQKYLEENNIEYRRIPYEYDYNMGNGEVRKIDFAYLVITK